MKRFTYLVLFGCISIAFSACGSQELASSNGNRNSNAAPQTVINNDGQGETATASELTNTNIETPANRQARRLEAMRAAANNQPQKPVPVNMRPAPEDSEITTTLTDVAREVRVWKKHPTLAKIEKIYDGQNVSIKVYLRDGRVIDLPGTAIAQLDQVPSAAVLTLVGIGPKAQSTSSGQTVNRTKKASN